VNQQFLSTTVLGEEEGASILDRIIRASRTELGKSEGALPHPDALVQQIRKA
jgi:hypothetical protein